MDLGVSNEEKNIKLQKKLSKQVKNKTKLSKIDNY